MIYCITKIQKESELNHIQRILILEEDHSIPSILESGIDKDFLNL